MSRYMKLAHKAQRTWRNYSKDPRRVAEQLKRRKAEIEQLPESELSSHEKVSRQYLIAALTGLIHAADTLNEPSLDLATYNLNLARIALEGGGERGQ
ncbi:hypothetical protein J0K78_17015 [Halobacillus sp. GSS1]|uniref:hypothetical protein n=1 Tax=Halobacillus sp. GSS1 TaxID=2815919 RepID=UPI001A8C1B2B|nr:hypothetical protein [Halobacillus sp. GSS1]MBN9655979.1 hypothetical protein [Halobacillus sp. GSS1]